jgi:hypothetical protein
MNQEQLTGTTDEFFNDICQEATYAAQQNSDIIR